MNRNDLQNDIISKIYTNVTEDITGDKLQVVLRNLNDNLVNREGDSMSGALTLPADPTSNLQAATKQYVDGKVEDTITNGVTTKAPSENAVFDALALKQNTLTFDTTPVDGSNNPVTSNGVFDALALKENTANKGVANGYASLNGSGLVPSSQLPSYVDDVIEVANYASLPVTGETSKIYVTIDTGYIYRWTGSIYVKIAEQIQSDYAQTNTSAVDYIKNKPTISVGLTMPSAFNVTGSPTSNGTLAVTGAGTSSQYVKGDGTLGTSVNGTVTSVGLTMPSAFNVSNSPITSNGSISVTGAGLSSQYVRGDGQLATFPTQTGGGSALNYYLNGSVSQGTFGGNTYYQMSRTAVVGAGTDFTIAANGYIARFITDAGEPALLSVPSGNWNLEFFFSASSAGGTPTFYVNVYKVSGTTFTLIGTNSTAPEGINNGTITDSYFTAVTIPTTALLTTDRIAIDIYVNNSGRTITLHTEDNHLCEVITTFSTGLNAINGLTNQVQYLATGTSGTDFAINSTTDTHTFNLPVASATNTGKLSSTDWSTFNGKQNLLVSSVNIQTINGNSILGSGNLQLATTKIRRHDTQLPYDYLGWAIDGTPESSTGWTITRLTITSAGTTTKGTASGAWSNRTSLTYI